MTRADSSDQSEASIATADQSESRKLSGTNRRGVTPCQSSFMLVHHQLLIQQRINQEIKQNKISDIQQKLKINIIT